MNTPNQNKNEGWEIFLKVISELEKDKARLDGLEAIGASIAKGLLKSGDVVLDDVYVVINEPSGEMIGKGKTIREAIDDAIQNPSI